MASCRTASEETLFIRWENMPAVPPRTGDSIQPGLAGPVAGALGESMFVAGGSNFPDRLPWKGGAKHYHDDLYLLKRVNQLWVWEVQTSKLPINLAYPACISIADGTVSLGGENESGPVQNVYRYGLKEGQVTITPLPSLPIAISAGGAACVGSDVFFTGGYNNKGASAGFFHLNLKTPENGWEQLPNMPVPLSHPLVVSQNDPTGPCIFVIGGRNKIGERSTFMSSVWKYPLKSGKWVKDSDILIGPDTIALSAATGIAFGEHTIIVFGGDQGHIFNQVEKLNADIAITTDPEMKELLLSEKDTILTRHPGFSKDILAYHTLHKTWKKVDSMPYATPVTTVAFYWNGTAIMPCGEIRPGVRTPNVLGAKISITK